MTEKLYYTDSHLYEFTARVISSEENKDRLFETVLDRTAFFPEGGGQPCDTGTIENANVLDVQEVGDKIIHFTDKALLPGAEVSGKLDREKRFSRMQGHSGEHILSGVIHSMYGFDNVGFHMEDEHMTVDFSGELDEAQLEAAELAANRAIYENVPVTALFPSPDELSKLEYRSKLDLTENVRIVVIEGYDSCACCAPHVSRTGEVGLIKITDHMRHRGGTRIQLLCGIAAYRDYLDTFHNNASVSKQLSAERSVTASAVTRILNEKTAMAREITELKKELLAQKLSALDYTPGNRCIFEKNMDPVTLRFLANEAKNSTGGVCAAFSGDDINGYSYVMTSLSTDVCSQAKAINSALNGRGGGRDGMIQGSVKCTKSEIEKYFDVCQ